MSVGNDQQNLILVGYLYEYTPEEHYLGESVSVYAAVINASPYELPSVFAVRVEPMELSPLSVELKDATLTSNYSGDRFIIANIELVNSSSTSTSFASEYEVNAYQNGVSLQRWYIGIDDSYDPSTVDRDVKPGASLTVQAAFILDDESEVSIELLDSWTGEVVESGTVAL